MIGINTYCKYERYYLGEPLVSKQIIIKEKPKYIYSKRNYLYTISGTEHVCQFWISKGALISGIEREMDSISIGDTILIGIRKADEDKLRYNDYNPRVIELSRHNRKVIIASKVKESDEEDYQLNLGGGIIFLILGTILQVREIVRQRYQGK